MKIGRDELERMRNYGAVFARGKNCRYVIFSKSGFAQELKECSDAGEVMLVTLNEMMNRKGCNVSKSTET